MSTIESERIEVSGSSAFLNKYKAAAVQALDSVSETEVAKVIDLLRNAREQGRQVFVCGNGGSAVMASHLVSELGKDASWGKQPRFRVFSLVDNVPWLTAVANDRDYSQVFAEQLRNFGGSGDILIGFSTSGTSANVIQAVECARELGLETVGVTGCPGGRLAELCDYVIRVDSPHIGHVQEGHFLIQHMLAYFFIDD